jgi:hypothetical protein
LVLALFCSLAFPLSADDEKGNVTLGQDEKGTTFVELSVKPTGQKPGKDQCYSVYIFLSAKDGPR